MLARALGKSVEELLRTTSAAELSEWRAFYRLERKLHEELAEDQAMERDAINGAHEIRSQLRGER